MSDPWAAYPKAEQRGAAADPWAAYPKEAPALPEFINLIPAGAEMAGGLPSFLGGKKKAPAGKLSVSAWQADKLKNAMAVAQDEDQMMDIIRGNLPDAKFSRNENDEIVVDVQGTKSVLNRKGASAQDVVTGTTQATAAALSATPAGLITSLPARAVATGLLVGSGSALQDVGAHAMGAEKVVDLPRVAIAGATGAAAEAVLSPIINSVYRFIASGGGRGLYDSVAGKLTAAGTALLKKAGATADEISDDVARSFAQQARTAADPAAALSSAEAAALPVPVRLTKGQTSMSEKQLRTEQLMKQGAMGEGAAGIMQANQANQQAALRANLPAIQERLAQGGAVIERRQGAELAQKQLEAMRRGEKKAAGEAFDVARGTSAGIPGEQMQSGGFAIRNAVAQDHSLSGLPRTSGLLDEFDALTQGGKDQQALVNAVFDWRKRASSARSGNVANEEGVALGKAIKGFDDWVNGVVTKGLIQGDEAAVAAWQQAIKQYREFAGKFKGGDLIEDLTEKASRGGKPQLKVAPEDAANYILGSSNTGWINRADLTRDLSKMRVLLGPKSEAWNGLRQEVFLRLARQGEGATQGVEQLFSGVKFQKAWNDMLKSNPKIVSLMFSPGERSLISQFAKVAARTTSEPRYSTAASASVLLQNLGGTLGKRVATFLANLPGSKPVMSAVNAARAEGATRGAVPQGRPRFTPRITAPASEEFNRRRGAR